MRALEAFRHRLLFMPRQLAFLSSLLELAFEAEGHLLAELDLSLRPHRDIPSILLALRSGWSEHLRPGLLDCVGYSLSSGIVRDASYFVQVIFE